MAERSRSISQKWHSIGAFTKIYKQLINKCHHKKFSASKRSTSKSAAANPKSLKQDHQKEEDEEIDQNEEKENNGIIRTISISSSSSSCPKEIIKHEIINERNNYYIVGSPPPSPSRSESPNLNSSRFISRTPPLRSPSSTSRRRNPSPLSKSTSRNYDDNNNNNNNNKINNMSFLSPSSPLSRNRSTGTRLLRNISKRYTNNSNNNNSNDSPTHGGGGNSPFSRSVSQRSANLIMYSNSNGVVKPPTLEEILECTLEELCFGCIKKIKTTRDAIANDGQILEEHEEVLTIKVQPGWRNGTKITFEGMGKGIISNRNCAATDITFTVAETKHSIFKREGNNDLEIAMEISLVEALTGCTVQIPLLSGENMSLSINDVIKPGYRKIISGQGMTIPHDDNNHDHQQEQGGKQQKRGNLIITFLVKFPIQLTKQQCSEIIRILNHST